MDSLSLARILTPHGHFSLVKENDAPVLTAEVAQRLPEAFARGSGHGLLQLGAGEVGTALPPALSYWREFGGRYVTALCTQPDTEMWQQNPQVPPPPESELAQLVLGAPVMPGAEY